MKLLIVALLSVALISHAKTEQPPVNNLETKVAVTAEAEKLASNAKEADKAVAKVEEPEPPKPEPQPEITPVITYGTHEELMAAAGISPKDYGAVDYIVSHESSWNENATEPTTGAHGLPQALPYSKTGCGWVDSVCQLKWASIYATERYGGWWGAYNHWSSNRWW